MNAQPQYAKGVYNDQDSRSTIRRVDTLMNLLLKGKIDTVHFDAAGYVMDIMESYHASAPGSLASPENIAPSVHAPLKRKSGWPPKTAKTTRTASDGVSDRMCDAMHQYKRLMQFLGRLTYEQRETLFCVVIKNQSINQVCISLIGNDAGKTRAKVLGWLTEALEDVDNEWALSRKVG